MKLLALLALVPTLASADVLTYDFTGTVTSASGNYASAVGDTVTGTYMINYSAAIPAQSSGTPGTPPWVSTSDYFAGDFPTDGAGMLVFTSTAQVIGTDIVYATSLPSPGFNVGAYVQGAMGALAASEQANQANNGNTQSFFEIGAPDPIFDASGGPVYPPSAFGLGDFAVIVNGGAPDSLGYSITSITPSTVPVPASAWLMLSGLAGLMVVYRKRALA